MQDLPSCRLAYGTGGAQGVERVFGMKRDSAPVIFISLILDALWGDPPNALHPVAWLGKGIARLESRLAGGSPLTALYKGAAAWAVGCAAVSGVVYALARLLRTLPQPLHWLAEGYLLKLCLSPRGLGRAAGQIQSALQKDDLPEARRLLSWHLVSRDTSGLNPFQVAAAAIESVAENTSDGIIAPLFFYTLGGLPAAWFYRFANTLDSMWGYHDSAHEWLGKVPARMDDVLNALPARLTALGLAFSAWLRGEDAARCLSIVWRDARKTDSPNAGYPMSAMAGALGVELEKAGQYKLGAGLPPPVSPDITRAVRLMQTTVLLAGVIFSLMKIKSAYRKPCHFE